MRAASGGSSSRWIESLPGLGKCVLMFVVIGFVLIVVYGISTWSV
jgi:hypothetical protein